MLLLCTACSKQPTEPETSVNQSKETVTTQTIAPSSSVTQSTQTTRAGEETPSVRENVATKFINRTTVGETSINKKFYARSEVKVWRTESSYDSGEEPIGTLAAGTEVFVISKSADDWAKIKYNSKTAYVYFSNLSLRRTPWVYKTTTTTAQASSSSKSSKGYTIVTQGGMTYVDGVLIANKTYSLPSSYNPGGLTRECSSAFKKMKQAAASEGLSLYDSSDFRSYETQTAIYNRYVAQDGRANADRYSARPGHSEHQTGLAIDLNGVSDSFGETKEGKWVEEHCHEFGFILRYPQGKEEVTGYMYEPWHIRYVGQDVAKKIHESGLCLEEFYGITSAYGN